MANPLHIIKGFWYWLFTPEHIQVMARRRMHICEACAWKEGPVCGICKCVLKAKTKVPEESCPALKWKSEKI